MDKPLLSSDPDGAGKSGKDPGLDAGLDLTPAQKIAVDHLDGPMLVLAGPGSGKTRVITRRIARLIERGIPPSEILALTFTNKAADEMRDRLRSMRLPRGTTLCTFHSLGARLLREFAERAGLSADFTVYDRSDQTAALRDLLAQMDLDPGAFPPAGLLQRIGRWKNALLSPEKVEERAGNDPLAQERARIYAAYTRRLVESAALDFDDLLMRTALLLRDDSEVRDTLNLRWRYILVDEYQDTNRCQYRIARDLSRLRRNLFVTGDPDQSIYGWRGADLNNILDFEKDFPETRVVRLEDNFRSCPQILDLADGLISANTHRKAKRLVPRRPQGERPRLYAFDDEVEEAGGMVLWIRDMHERLGLDYREIAVFYRINAMSRVLEEALMEAGLPYQIVRGLEFYGRREIKDMLAYLRVVVNPCDRVSLLRIINRPARGLGAATLGRLIAQAENRACDLWSVVAEPGGKEGIGAAARLRIDRFVERMEHFRSLTDKPVAGIVREVFEGSGLLDQLEKEKNSEAVENVEELIHSALLYDEQVEHADLAGFLQRIALVSDPDAYDENAGAVSLMTLHAAKGLEFPAVWIAGVEQGMLPHNRIRADEKSHEEERRLLFVGITRAERHLALSYARRRAARGARRETGPSPFLFNLAGLERMGTAAGGPSRSGIPRSAWAKPRDPFPAAANAGPGNPSGFPPRPSPSPGGGDSPSPPAASLSGDPFAPGRRVRHPNLGLGRIVQTVSGEEGKRAVVQFDGGARLTLDLRFARLEEID